MTDRTPLLALLLAAIVVAAMAVAGPADESQARTSESDRASGFLTPPSASAHAGDEVGDRAARSRAAAHSAEQGTNELATLPSSPRARAFRARVDEIISRWVGQASKASRGKANGNNVTVAVHALERATGEELCARNIDLPLRPASNMKLVTSAAAWVLLGPEWEFETRFEGAGQVRGGVLEGNLVVRAAGDPLYAADAMGATEARLDAVVERLQERGVRRIRGDLVLDEGSFPDPGPGPEWPPENQYWQTSCALAGGFTVSGGILHARVTPRAVGQAAAIEVHPAPHGLRERYGVKTVSKKINDVRVGANAAGVTVGGSIGRSVGTVEADFAHPDPVELFGAVLEDRLARGGIRVDGSIVRRRGATGGPVLAVLRSPLADTFVPILRDSVNSVADQVFFALALAIEGSADREAGRAATSRALARLGVSDEGLVQVDGSGLSRAGRVTARQLTHLLGAALERETGSILRSALAVGGRSGTLEKRMRGTAAEGRVQGKTGWIRGASSLSGVVQSKDGSERVFSILVSYPADISGLNTSCFKPMQDELAVALVELGS